MDTAATMDMTTMLDIVIQGRRDAWKETSFQPTGWVSSKFGELSPSN